MARCFDTQRGRAIAVATMGFAAGEALLPFLAVASISVIGWRWTYGVTSILLGMALLPLTLWLLRGHHHHHRHHQHSHGPKNERKADASILEVLDGILHFGSGDWFRLNPCRFSLRIPGCPPQTECLSPQNYRFPRTFTSDPVFDLQFFSRRALRAGF